MNTVNADLRDLVRVAERLAIDAGLENVAARLQDNRSDRDRPGTRVAVVGDFNRGKSTLINRLLGADVLPTGNVPLTRAFVVVRAVADGPATLDIRWPSGATERRELAHDDPWHGLVLDHELETVRVGEGQAAPEEPHLLLSTPSQWLSRVEAELIDTPGLHEGRVDHLLQTQRAVALSDVVVITIAAPSPVSLLERHFLEEELLTKRAPHVIVVLTKVDQLPPDEVEDFVDWFRARIAEMSSSIAVAVGPGLSPEGADALAALRDRISDLAHSSDMMRRRDQRLVWQLADACAAISSAAQAVGGQLGRDQASRQAAIRAAKQQLDADDLRWNQLRLSLDERRLQFTETMRQSVSMSASDLFETLDVELSHVVDIKAWWERELPVRLRHGLKNLVHGLESQITTIVSRDLRWLDAEVTQAFQIARKPVTAGPVSEFSVGELPAIKLDDVRRRRTATRIVTAAGGIAGAAIAFASGVGMPAAFTLGGSAIAAIIAERDADAKTEQQRAVVRKELRRLVDDVIDQFSGKLSTEVDRSYRVAFEELQDARAIWRTARLDALATTADDDPDVTVWTGIRYRADEITAQIPAYLAGQVAPGREIPLAIDVIDQDDQQGDRT
jgi:GTP-binding protein EngB required for normal cell division